MVASDCRIGMIARTQHIAGNVPAFSTRSARGTVKRVDTPADADVPMSSRYLPVTMK